MKMSPGKGASVAFENLTKQYGSSGRLAVDHVNLSIEAGEFLTLLGPSGSGKTTALNMIAGIVDVTSGSILVNGQDVSRTPPNRRNFGMVFQNYALFPHMTVSQNVQFPLRQRRVAKADSEQMVASTLEMMDLQGLGDRHPHELSGGQQQRVALARAIVFSPSLLLLDEPLAALDRKLRQALQLELKRLHDQLGLTFIFVTHDQDEAMFLSDRIAVFNEGRCEAVGAPSELYDHPKTLFVAKFLGESNVFRGRVDEDGFFVWGERRLSVGGPVPSGPEVALVVRPERLQLFDAGAKVPDGMNHARARVISTTYLGVVSRLDVEFEDGHRGGVILAPGIAANATVGESLTVAWRVEDQSMVLDGSGGPNGGSHLVASRVNATSDNDHSAAPMTTTLGRDS